MSQDNEIVILSAVRTPIGSFCGALSSIKAHDLGAAVIKEAVSRAGIQPSDVSEVIFGQVLTSGQGQNPARQASVKAGLPHSIPATLVNMLCGSGLRTVAMGAQAIRNGDSDFVVVGGQESMSQAQHSVLLREGIKMGNGTLTDTMVLDGLTDAFHDYHMGITAENIAKQFNISRQDQDAFAFSSQQKTAVAQKQGAFNEEILPIIVKGRKGDTEVSKDEYPKNDTTLEVLNKLRPAFSKDGTVTAGNASGLNDGAAALVLTSKKLAASKGLKPMAKIVSQAWVGVDPAIMGTGPIPAVRLALSKAGWKSEDVDLFELNEAFSAQALAVVRELKVDAGKVNVRGGAVALGHPIGASGARVLVTLLHALKQSGGKKGVAALCVGGGMGIAVCVEIL
jgi:acetyl-CoA C-acetyltransferase